MGSNRFFEIKQTIDLDLNFASMFLSLASVEVFRMSLERLLGFHTTFSVSSYANNEILTSSRHLSKQD